MVFVTIFLILLLFAIRTLLADYLGKMHPLFHEFNDLLSPTSTSAQELEQWSKFFMVFILQGLPDKYSHVCDQILGSPVIANFTSTCSTLLCVLCKSLNDPYVFANNFSTLTSQHDDRNRSHNTSKGCPKCDHCGKLGNKIDKCYALHGRPPRYVAFAQTNPPSQSSLVDPPSSAPIVKSTLSNEFLKWCEDRKPSSSIAFVARTGISFVDLTQSSSIGP